jgi:hypothetical protein
VAPAGLAIALPIHRDATEDPGMSTSWRPSLARVPFGRLAFELFLVFVAVFGALFANARWQESRERAAGRAALTAFATEMRGNLEQIEARLPHHREVIASTETFLKELANGAEPPRELTAIRERLTGNRGMRTPILARAAWDTSLATGACGQIPLATMLRIGGVYELQRKLEVVLDQLLVNVTSPAFFEVERARATATGFQVTFAMIVELEVNQVAAYQQCLAMITGG